MYLFHTYFAFLKLTIQRDCLENRHPRPLQDESVETLCGIAAMRNRSVQRRREALLFPKQVHPRSLVTRA
jgi:hypothetical protein